MCSGIAAVLVCDPVRYATHPHPNPLPAGEGINPVATARGTDLSATAWRTKPRRSRYRKTTSRLRRHQLTKFLGLFAEPLRVLGGAIKN